MRYDKKKKRKIPKSADCKRAFGILGVKNEVDEALRNHYLARM